MSASWLFNLNMLNEIATLGPTENVAKYLFQNDLNEIAW
jgi:hypothetical protein